MSRGNAVPVTQIDVVQDEIVIVNNRLQIVIVLLIANIVLTGYVADIIHQAAHVLSQL